MWILGDPIQDPKFMRQALYQMSQLLIPCLTLYQGVNCCHTELCSGYCVPRIPDPGGLAYSCYC